MVEKDDLQNLGGDLSLPGRRFLLGLSSEPPDIAPLPGIALARLRLSNDAINDIVNDNILSTLTVSAPAGRE
jgi:hypothetical protein